MAKRGRIVCLEKWNGTATGIEKLQVNGTGVPPIGTKKKKKEVKKKIRKSRPFFLTFKLGEDLFGWPAFYSGLISRDKSWGCGF